MIEVLLVDDHDLVREGIRLLLESSAAATGIKVIAEASSGEQALQMVQKYKPDVVLLDISMPGIGGLETARRLLKGHPEIKVIVLTVHSDGIYPKKLLEAGVHGYLTKSCGIDEMIEAIRQAYRGQRYVAKDIAQKLAVALLPGGNISPFDRLSGRELQIVILIAHGYKITEISDMLCLSPKTVSTYKSRLLGNLAINNELELIRLATQHGMFEDHFTA